MSKANTIDLDLTTIANLGQAMGRHEGKVVFVPLSLPGERVRVRIVEERKRWARAELVDVIDASPDRVEPPCPYYGLCGGCHWQHAAYPAQLAYKHQVVAEQLRRLGRLEAPTVRPAIGAPLVDGVPEPWFYRNHAQFTAVEPGAPLNPGAPPDLGATMSCRSSAACSCIRCSTRCTPCWTWTGPSCGGCPCGQGCTPAS
jgi:tRNA/tmRNA/rRNA uracil-C5-methylase (TrmA/RlmC/RlmD family)